MRLCLKEVVGAAPSWPYDLIAPAAVIPNQKINRVIALFRSSKLT
jgi:hypothetical protein